MAPKTGPKTTSKANDAEASTDTVSTTSTTSTVDARSVSLAANRGLVIDFAAGKTAADLASEKAQVRSQWTDRLNDLVAGVTEGPGEYDTFYKIGKFANTNGARSVIRDLSKNPAKLPAGHDFDMESRKAGNGSELWAAVVTPEG